METKALLFIPDISGFTKFINETEIQHSKYIISKLLNAIIKSNFINLEISEIEGDAVLFFRKGEPPSVTELLEQVKRTFIEFHHNKNIIQRETRCQCGACSTVNNLTLKFIVHYGKIEEAEIQNHKKLFGSDVIIVHRLLKNSIGEKEYLLMTEEYISTQNQKFELNENWIRINRHIEKIPEFDQVQTHFIVLSPLLQFIPKN